MTSTGKAESSGTSTRESSEAQRNNAGHEAPVAATASDPIDSATPAEQPTQNTGYLAGIPLAILVFCLFLVGICTGLDRSIVSTAIPTITSEFHSLDDIGWYGSAYILTSSCFQLFYGKLYAEFSTKPVFLSALAIFELGSIVCALAPTSMALIIGRAVAGVGSAGLFTGSLMILTSIIPLHSRPKYMAIIASGMTVSQAFGPLIGGAFTQHLTWRWCFWINLPVGGVTIIGILLFAKFSNPDADRMSKTWRDGAIAFFRKADLFGALIIFPSIVCLLLALQWGGVTYPWNNWRIILLICLFGLLFLVWAIRELRNGEKATVPSHIIKQRSMAAATWGCFCLPASMFIVVYYVPTWFQVIQDVSATQSGVNLLPLTVSQSVASIISGAATGRVGHYVPQQYISATLCSIAAGLIYTFNLSTSTPFWAASLVLFGIGFGAGVQTYLMVPQTTLAGRDIALGSSLLIFGQTLSSSIFLSVAQSIFQTSLMKNLSRTIPNVDPSTIISIGASDVRQKMAELYPSHVPEALGAYNTAINDVSIISITMASLSIFAPIFMEWKSVRKDIQPKPDRTVKADA
ncbi:MFS general substrate transporter [Thozetella sp. PMI_491]|nr:MFS general substrate transporter [Thozetella sp. PMI_491]